MKSQIAQSPAPGWRRDLLRIAALRKYSRGSRDADVRTFTASFHTEIETFIYQLRVRQRQATRHDKFERGNTKGSKRMFARRRLPAPVVFATMTTAVWSVGQIAAPGSCSQQEASTQS